MVLFVSRFFLYTIDDIRILIIDSTKTDEALSCSKPDVHLPSGRRSSGFLIEINYTDKIIHINQSIIVVVYGV